jgi:tetratricopeptide (TPR) repeat protein
MLERVHHGAHPNLAVGYYDLGVELRDQGRLNEAAARFRQSIAMDDRFLARTHRDRGQSRLGLASVLMAQRRHAAAEPVLRRSLAMRREALPPEHRYVRETETELAACLTALRRFREAEALLVPAYEGLRATEGAADGRTQRARQRLVELYEAWGKAGDAARYRG